MTYYGRAAKQVLQDNCEDWEDIPTNETRNYNHTTCPAGEDTRGRLGVKNVSNTWLWHCFNCGESGYYRPKEVFSRLLDKGEVEEVKHAVRDPIVEYYTHEHRYDAFPNDHKLWLASYGFFKEEVERLGIRSSDFGVYLPVYNRSVKGYQVRNMTGHGPKYTTHTISKLHVVPSTHDNCVVIVEDLLSSYKVGLAGFTCVALMGTKLHVPASELPRAEHCVIWLDADSAGTTGAIKLAMELSPIYENVTTIVNKQPKELSIEELQNVLRP
jgi:hypothetical protein